MISIVLGLFGIVSACMTIYISLLYSSPKEKVDQRNEYHGYLININSKKTIQKKSKISQLKSVLFFIWKFIVFMIYSIFKIIMLFYTIILLIINLVMFMISMFKLSYKTICIIILCFIFMKSILNFLLRVIGWILWCFY